MPDTKPVSVTGVNAEHAPIPSTVPVVIRVTLDFDTACRGKPKLKTAAELVPEFETVGADVPGSVVTAPSAVSLGNSDPVRDPLFLSCSRSFPLLTAFEVI